MATFQHDSFGLTRSSHAIQVPENYVAKLMYYLDVALTLVEYDDGDLNELRDYKRYYALTGAEKQALYLLCAMLDPDDLIDKVMFEDETGALCGQSMNRLYDISQVRHSLTVVNSVFIGGRQRRVKKVMFYRPEWLRKFYILPVLTAAAEIEQAKRQKAISDLVETCTIS